MKKTEEFKCGFCNTVFDKILKQLLYKSWKGNRFHRILVCPNCKAILGVFTR